MRLLPKLGATLLIALLAAVGTASADKPGDKVTAGGITGADSRMGGEAQSGPSGEDAKGQFNLRNDRGIGDIKGKVTCLKVYGNRATVEIQINKAADPSLVGMYREMFLEDNGNPGDNQGQPDDFIYGNPPQPTSSNCNDPFNKNVPLFHGNIQVYDAQP